MSLGRRSYEGTSLSLRCRSRPNLAVDERRVKDDFSLLVVSRGFALE